MDKTINFEQNIKELEDVVRQLEGGDVSLDQLLVLFEKGVGLTKSCNSQLDNAEQKINMLIQNKTTGEPEEVPMTENNVGDATLGVPQKAQEPPAPLKTEEPPKVKGAHFVSTIDDIPPLPENQTDFEEPPVSDEDAPPDVDNAQQSMLDGL